ncbi:MAG: HAD-IB family phosphatase [Bacteroidota bacterium]
MALVLFVDFDGTVTRGDVGNALFRTFGGEECDRLVAQYRSGVIGARECFRAEAEAMGRFSVERLHGFIDGQAIDDSFPSLVEFCRERGIELTILSDGLDYYIERILQRHGCGRVPFFANHLTLVDRRDDGTAQAAIEFSYADAECKCCACCKRNVMLTRAGDDDVLCLVGEGFSDRCPAGYADIVFAKDSLQTYCQLENISYFPYTTFRDVIARLQILIAGTRLRPKRRAVERRQAAFRQES